MAGGAQKVRSLRLEEAKILFLASDQLLQNKV
jgi:hypothetical protein